MQRIGRCPDRFPTPALHENVRDDTFELRGLRDAIIDRPPGIGIGRRAKMRTQPSIEITERDGRVLHDQCP